MNLDEARKILWLKSNHRPLGELLDEGFLTKERLEWAVQWAYSPKLQQAAQVLLEAMKSPLPNIEEIAKPVANPQSDALPISIPLDKARITLWPFTPFKNQPMGTLVESKQLSLKDLAYAIETAWDEKIRQAAIALMLVRLNQAVKEPLPSEGFLKIVSGGRSYSERQQTRYTMLLGLIFGSGLTLLLFLMKWSFTARVPSANAKSFSDIVSTPVGVIALIAVILGYILLGWLGYFTFTKITNELEIKIDQYRLGQEGEDNVVQSIIQALDGNWHLFRNVSLPGRNKGDLDIVLVGPPGVWVLEVKNFNGEYRNIGENWEYRHGKVWKAASVKPSRQALNGAVRLANFLRADNINAFVNPTVIWANQENLLIVENPSVAVWQYNNLADELGNIWQAEKLSETERKRISEKLTKLCETQKKKD